MYVRINLPLSDLPTCCANLWIELLRSEVLHFFLGLSVVVKQIRMLNMMVLAYYWPHLVTGSFKFR